FDRLRIAQAGGAAGLNSGSDPIALGPIQNAVERFRKDLVSRSDYDSSGGCKAMVDQIDKYQDKLFADPITVQTPHGPLVIQPQRTNNIMERFFRDFWRFSFAPILLVCHLQSANLPSTSIAGAVQSRPALPQN